MRQKFREYTEIDVTVWILVAVAIIGIIVGLIEWNARRQAAALTHEMLRPATAEEKAAIDAIAEESERELKKQLAAEQRYTQQQMAELRQLRAKAAARSLEDNERCIGGTRMRRVDNGWQQVNEECP
jgi:hypothetical protein